MKFELAEIKNHLFSAGIMCLGIILGYSTHANNPNFGLFNAIGYLLFGYLIGFILGKCLYNLFYKKQQEY